MSEPFITTYPSGNRVEFLNPLPDQLEIEDIAHSLSRVCRYGGHCEPFYSVAEHCCRASLLCTPENRLGALLHDAAEAYLGDVTRPLKQKLPEYKIIEAIMSNAIEKKWGVTFVGVGEIKEADEIMLATEAASLTRIGALDPYLEAKAMDVKIVPWSMHVAEARYLSYFEQYVAAQA